MLTTARTRRAWLALGGAGLAALGFGGTAPAAAADPAAQQVDGLDAALLEAMKTGKTQSARAATASWSRRWRGRSTFRP